MAPCRYSWLHNTRPSPFLFLSLIHDTRPSRGSCSHLPGDNGRLPSLLRPPSGFAHRLSASKHLGLPDDGPSCDAPSPEHFHEQPCLATFSAASRSKDFFSIPIQNMKRRLPSSGNVEFLDWLGRRARRLLQLLATKIQAGMVASKDGNNTHNSIADAMMDVTEPIELLKLPIPISLTPSLTTFSLSLLHSSSHTSALEGLVPDGHKATCVGDVRGGRERNVRCGKGRLMKPGKGPS